MAGALPPSSRLTRPGPTSRPPKRANRPKKPGDRDRKCPGIRLVRQGRRKLCATKGSAMLVLLGPPFQGTDEEYARLAQATGILAYELRTKIKPNAWGVVRALGDERQALELAGLLAGQGFRVSVVDPALAGEPDRMFVPLRTIELSETGLVLHLTERSMAIPYPALVAIVRGEVQLGSRPRREMPSSSTFRAVVPSAIGARSVPGVVGIRPTGRLRGGRSALCHGALGSSRGCEDLRFFGHRRGEQHRPGPRATCGPDWGASFGTRRSRK